VRLLLLLQAALSHSCCSCCLDGQRHSHDLGLRSARKQQGRGVQHSRHWSAVGFTQGVLADG
jgi:hypothetical protein